MAELPLGGPEAPKPLDPLELSGPPDPPELQINSENANKDAVKGDAAHGKDHAISLPGVTIRIDPNQPPDAEAAFFNKQDENDKSKLEQIRQARLKNDRQEQDNTLSKHYARRAYKFSKCWVGFLLTFIPTQMVLESFHLGLSPSEFIAVIGSLSLSVLGYWWLVGRYLFPANPK